MSTTRVLVVENDASDPAANLGEWLEAAGVELVVVRPHLGEPLPADLGDYQGLLVMGGAMGAADDGVAPWLPAVRALLVEAVRRETPTLAVCLGAQLLGLALGGRVAVNPEGPEFGAGLIAKRQAASGDPLFRALPITPDVIQWHEDAVIDLPAGAVLLASSPGCAVQAFRIGRTAWGLQFHLENTPEMVREWAVDTAAAMHAAGRDVEATVSRTIAVLPDVAETWAPFAAAFAAVVADPDSVRIARTVPSSTAEPISDKAAIRAALAAEADAARGIGPLAPEGRALPLAPHPRP